jgi:Ni,Fe-hydrogenase I large subunit
MANVILDPITRIEGHLGIELETDGSNVVTSVQAQGQMFRGFELILKNRNPRDAVILTQRICGV